MLEPAEPRSKLADRHIRRWAPALRAGLNSRHDQTNTIQKKPPVAVVGVKIDGRSFRLITLLLTMPCRHITSVSFTSALSQMGVGIVRILITRSSGGIGM
jgi:hypothetical protein